jgi:zinc transport system permease protein
MTTTTIITDMTMLDDFLIRAGLAGLAVGLAAGPLGCFVVWRRMAYFGDAVAHAAILGVAISFGFGISVNIGILATSIIMGLGVLNLTGKGLAADSILGVLAHSALAAGIVAASLLQGVRIDLTTYLFGDILAVSVMDIWIVWGGGLVVVALLVWRWQSLLTSTLSPDLAHASGLSPKVESYILTLCLAIVVAMSIKIVGALLIAALLIIPAAAARNISSTPERMAFIASALGAGATIIGLWASFQFDTPSGPSIVCAAAGLFALCALIGRTR